jgi:hypothetical protein
MDAEILLEVGIDRPNVEILKREAYRHAARLGLLEPFYGPTIGPR